METRTYKVYKYNELTEDQKEKAVDRYCDINIDFDWWDNTYNDAANIGLKLTGFDLGRASYCEGKFITTALECAEKILKKHGKDCETFKTVQCYLKDRSDIEKDATPDEYGDYVLEIEDEINSLADVFLNDILEDYRQLLSAEYDYLTSREQIAESLIANEYDFIEDGKID